MKTSLLLRLLPFLVCSFTVLIAVILVCQRNVRYVGSANRMVAQHRASLALIVQVVSSAQGACQVYAVAALLNCYARQRLQQKPMSLESLQFWSAASTLKLRLSLPFSLVLPLLVAILFLQVPQALWAGALTPLIVSDSRTDSSVAIATYPAEYAEKYWRGSFYRDPDATDDFVCLTCRCATIGDLIAPNGADGTLDFYDPRGYNYDNFLANDYSGVVSTCPARDLLEGLLVSVGAASTPGARSRIDDSGWTVTGRSYGVGGSPGLVNFPNPSPESMVPLAYEYVEDGWNPQVLCQRNESSEYAISQSNDCFALGGDNGCVATYLVGGYLPNSRPNKTEGYTLSQSHGGNAMVAWAALPQDNVNMLAIAATGAYNLTYYTNNLQCTVRFERTRYSVYVNTTAKSITVTPSATQDATPVEAGETFLFSVFSSLEFISRTASITVSSMLGDRIKQSQQALNRHHLISASIADNNTFAILGVQNSVTALLDDLLLAYSQAQVALLRNTTTTPLTTRYNAVRIGLDVYIFSALSVSLFLLLLVLAELVRTRCWKDLLRFDFTDISCAIVATSTGGTSVADACEARYLGHGEDQAWTGNPADRIAGKVMVMLRRSGHDSDGKLALVSDGADTGADMEMESDLGGGSKMGYHVVGLQQQE